MGTELDRDPGSDLAVVRAKPGLASVDQARFRQRLGICRNLHGIPPQHPGQRPDVHRRMTMEMTEKLEARSVEHPGQPLSAFEGQMMLVNGFAAFGPVPCRDEALSYRLGPALDMDIDRTVQLHAGNIATGPPKASA